MSKPRVIFSTGSLYIYDTAYCFKVAAEAGCDGVEIMCDQRWSTRSPDYLNQLSEEYAMPILSLHSPMLHIVNSLFGWDVPLRLVETAERTVELAETLEAETVVVHLPPKVGLVMVRTPQKSLMLPWLRNIDGKAMAAWIDNELAAYQAKTNVNIAVENLPIIRLGGRKANPHFHNTPEKWATSAPKLTMDTTHWATHGVKPLDAYQLAKDRIVHVHLSNYNGREHRLPHKGSLDLAALLETMASDGFTGTICIELHPDALGAPDEEAIVQNLRESVDFCKTHLAVN